VSIDPKTQRVENYWTARAHDFGTVRKNELNDPISERWLEEFRSELPGGSLKILDVGTGTGYFAILLSREGHRVVGVDLTPAMIEEARETSAQYGVAPAFALMDAQALDFPDGSFDAVVTRNLIWTLPDPKKAYAEWFRVLRPGGVLLNFDADYAQNVRNRNQKESHTTPNGVYGHIGLTPELSRENAEITLSMPAAEHTRPDWDLELLYEAGFSRCSADPSAGRRVLRDRDLSDAPLFRITARK